MFHVPEKYRERKHPLLRSDSSYGNAGMFIIPHHRISDYFYAVQASDGEGWEHASISLVKEVKKTDKAYKRVYGTVDNPGGVHQHREVIYERQSVDRCPTWEEMCYIKDLFWDTTDCVIQYHPPESHYVSQHHYCLHLWRPTGENMPVPDSVLVGINLKSENQ